MTDVKVMNSEVNGIDHTDEVVREQNRRIKNVRVPYDLVLQSLLGSNKRFALLVDAPEIPKGCEVLGVRDDPWTRSFIFCIRHSSFDPVIEGWEIPILHTSKCLLMNKEFLDVQERQ